MRQAAILTISDRGYRGKRTDTSGPLIRGILHKVGFNVVHLDILPDDQRLIEERLRYLADESCLDLLVTTGGTGVSPQDLTPEATVAVIHRQIPGMAEAMRAASLRQPPHAMLSRAVAGIRGQTLIINLPGSATAAQENLEAVFPAIEHALDKIQGDQTECGQRPGSL